jgi:hypothetical protein
MIDNFDTAGDLELKAVRRSLLHPISTTGMFKARESSIAHMYVIGVHVCMCVYVCVCM